MEAQRLKPAQERLQEELQQVELQLEGLPRLLVGRVLACENDLPCASGDAGRATDLYLLLAE